MAGSRPPRRLGCDRVMRWVLPAVLFTLAAVPAPVTACPMSSPSTGALAAQGDTIADGGGVLLETVVGFGGRDRGPERLLLRAGRQTIAEAIPISGALSLLPTPRGTGAVQLVDGDGTVLRTFKRVAAPKRLAAPKLKAIAMTVPPNAGAPTRPKDPYSSPIVTTTVELATAPPADAVAIVFYAGKEARGWYAVSSGSTSYSTQTGGKQCSRPAGGTLYTQIGERLTAAWVDRYGRVNARSAPLTVRARP